MSQKTLESYLTAKNTELLDLNSVLKKLSEEFNTEKP